MTADEVQAFELEHRVQSAEKFQPSPVDPPGLPGLELKPDDYWVADCVTRNSSPLAIRRFERRAQDICREGGPMTLRFSHWLCGWIDVLLVPKGQEHWIRKSQAQ